MAWNFNRKVVCPAFENICHSCTADVPGYLLLYYFVQLLYYPINIYHQHKLKILGTLHEIFFDRLFDGRYDLTNGNVFKYIILFSNFHCTIKYPTIHFWMKFHRFHFYPLVERKKANTESVKSNHPFYEITCRAFSRWAAISSLFERMFHNLRWFDSSPLVRIYIIAISC